MEERTKKIIIEDLESRLPRLPGWQKKATLEAIDIIENKDPNNQAMYINLRTAGHFDLADLFLDKKTKAKHYKKVKTYNENKDSHH